MNTLKTSQLKPATSDFSHRLSKLVTTLDYEFTDISLPKLALTHRSYDSQNNYERLEFLGDALLGMIIGEALYHRYPQQKEGVLTRMRATLVRQESLVKIAQKLGLSGYLILGTGERKGGGRQRASILADTVEALIGAIYLDSGDIEIVRKCVLSWYSELIDNVSEFTVLKDAKSRLQEWLQGKQLDLPSYKLLETVGNAPNQTFIVECQVNVQDCLPITQSGVSRRIAEQKTAELMINQLEKLTTIRAK